MTVEESRKGKTIKSAFDSTTFDQDVSIFVDRDIGSATISPSGRDVAVASNEGLDIIDLDSPLNPPRHLRHGLPWIVADVQWSPFAARDYWVVSTANQKALVWNLMQDDTSLGPIEHTLNAHTRAITDINFSAHHPDMLATCAVDGYVHCWDLRRARKPVLTFCDWFAGATQVKYNRQDPHILASSHDRWLRIWDDRKGAVPLRSINAHESKIYGVDWNRTRATGVVTCSLDKSIKFWDYSNEEDQPEDIIKTDFPVWRARHTPFGWGLLAMPQDIPGNLHLYDRRPHDGAEKGFRTELVKTFPGHGDHKVKEFLWRARGGVADDGVDNREFQLVSWGDDHHLRLQQVDPEYLAGVGYIKGTQGRKNLNLTRKGAVYKTFRTVESSSTEKKLPMMIGTRHGGLGLKYSSLNADVRKAHPFQTGRAQFVSRAPAMRRRNKPTKDDRNQIGWMSGIKFNKRVVGSTQAKRDNSRRLSMLIPEFDEWDAPESLHDEIVRIHEQLPKITFDDVNMDKRTIVASMNGPWGQNGTHIYIQITVVFPEQYPTKAPSFTLGKSSLLPGDTYSKLKRELHQIATGFVSRRQGCLEATLCYLLGEVDLETSTTFFKDVEDLDDDLGALADESSSDEEDRNVPAGASTMMSQELETSAVESMLTPGHRNANVPIPRQCGARFSAGGKLVCFFPPKEDKVKSLFETLVAKTSARPRGEPVFLTFGRILNNASPVPRIKTMSITSEGRSDSDASDDSEYSSSSGSDSTPFPPMSRFHMSNYFRRDGRRPARKGSPTVLSQRSSTAGTGTGTGTGTGIGRGRSSKPKNIVALHPIGDLLPSKIELAQEYAIFGNGPDVCEHNANIAESHGYHDLANVWRYASMLLDNAIPLEVLDQTHRHEPIFIVAKDAIKRKRANSGSDSGIDLPFDPQNRRNSISGRVRWGTSPFAKQLISNLFEYFEAIADVQMLAMLSCIFSEPLAKDAALQAELQMTQPQTPLSMKTPAFSLDYFPTDAAAWSMYQKTPINSTVSTPKFSHTPTGYYGSAGSSNGAWTSDPASASYSCGETPPLKSNRGSAEHLYQHSQSLSTSPDNLRNFRRANSGLASSFASFSRPFSMASSSPPNPINRKRTSPVENIMSSLAPSAITWGNTTVLGSVKEQTITERSSYSDDESTKGDWRPTICTGISLTIENQNVFDDEGCMSTPLLEMSKAPLFTTYRRAYAELLYFWRQPLARLEILKFNGLRDYFSEPEIAENRSFAASTKSNDTQTEGSPPSPIILGKKDQLQSLSNDEGLDVTGYCLKHESRLEPLVSDSAGGATGHCERCKAIQCQLRCSVCMEPVSALYSPCLSCGCVTHEHCLSEYHTEGNTDCPGGCDCDCGALASAGVVESWEVMMSAIERMRMLDSKHGKENQALEDWDGDEKTDWEHLNLPANGLPQPHSTLAKRIGQVRGSDWGMLGGKKKVNSLRKEEIS